jgi:ribosomal protein L11 methyltransferase
MEKNLMGIWQRCIFILSFERIIYAFSKDEFMTTATYLQLSCCGKEQTELLIGLLSIHPFEAFEEVSDGFHAYLPETEWTTSLKEEVQRLEKQFGVSFSVEKIENKNWNAIWEAGFSPITIDDFCHIRASFHPAGPKVSYELIIDPKMAFGTGHHATTAMMIQSMRELEVEGQSVLDYGCGTGVLAILARQMGAEPVMAIDYDPNSVENTLENGQQNQTPDIAVLEGDLDVLPSGSSYWIILANINRNVLLKSLPTLYSLLEKGGHLLLSGFVEEDGPLMETRFSENGFRLLKTRKEGEWLCMMVTK